MVTKISEFENPMPHGAVLPEVVLLAGEIYKETIVMVLRS